MPSGIRALDGLGRKEVKDTGPAAGTARFAGGRAKIMHREGGMVRIYAERKSGRILGAEMVAPDGEHLAHLLAWSMQEEQTVFDLLSMPYYHPVLEETLEVALADLSEKVEGDHRPLHGFKTVDNSIFEKERR
jgi:dihydrolipoamide dehydrogenase